MSKPFETIEYSTGLRLMPEVNQNVKSRAKIFCALLIPVVLYMLAKNIATSRVVTLDQFEYWAVGLIPVYATYLLTKVNYSGSPEFLNDWSSTLSMWVAAVITYLIFQTTFYSERFEFFIQQTLGFATFASFVAIALVYSFIGTVVGYFGFVVFFRSKYSSKFQFGLLQLFQKLMLIWLLFLILVFLI